jgi:hypothetical protein
MYRIILIAAIAAASIAAVVLYIRKRRSRPKLKKSQATEHTIEESLLDDITPDKDISQKTDDIDSIKRR